MNSIAEVLRSEFIGKEVTVRGWVYRSRSMGKKAFVVIRDSTGIIQAVAERSMLPDEQFDLAEGITAESSVEATGTVVEDRRAPGQRELKLKSLKVFCRNESFPVTKDKGEEFLLDIRHLWLRSREFTSMLKIRSTVFKSFADYFYGENYYQVQAPMMVSTATEGGSTLFKVPFFGEEVNLTQSSQFYLETMIFSLEKVFTIAPSFRAEKSRTRRHLTEYWHAEGEVAWFGNEEMMQEEEKMVSYIIKEVIKNNTEDLERIGRDINILKSYTSPFPRMKYSEVIELGKSLGMNVKYGDDLGADEERTITMQFKKPTFITDFPAELKSFYHRPNPANPETVLCHDLLAPEGYGEVIGGGERIWELDVLQKRLKDFGLREEDYYWYVDLRRYGSVPHSGFGLGLDRLVMWICGLESIRDAIPFPRTIRRMKP